VERAEQEAPRPVIAVAPNSPWNLLNFRRGLLLRLAHEGFAPLLIAPAEAGADRKLDELGFERVEVDIVRSGLNPIHDAALLLSYARIFRSRRPAAFLGFTIKPNIYGSIAARLCGIPAIANVSGLGTVFMKNNALTEFVVALYRFAFRRNPVVFFQNPDDRELFLSRKIVRPEQARLLPGSGIDLKAFAPVALPPGAPIFLLIARLLGDKGVREFVEAARLVRAVRPDVRFQLLGPLDHANRSAIGEDELQSWVSAGDVEYLGGADDVRPAIAAASAVVLPSYREGLPRSLLEGAAMGRPLIATDVPGCRELVKEGTTGFLCEARSSSSLAEAMTKLVELAPSARGEMGAAARALVERDYGEERVIDAYLEALRSFAIERSLPKRPILPSAKPK
jgi:glycosyltransferase involved in cell wall biosynthesis